ncbi:heterokaryon incompatibility protein-domain-containing protein [Xylaria bambusicola]|uniref:heterokaryon incompatibility protein-domain-containing protein n=1 Tax=Xylaria bambusicola TaxID=326684 RepID=UPI002007668C|nr:heterokaryon incompatibility protein-domain-containing protein [Xylaria bambusicola]KAI0520855.1 heterokaryon incompatibility protein-domain-containing protein [Xylaria bambusicola]
MRPYRYLPLQPGRKIRILKLAAGQEGCDLEGELIHVDLDQDPEYSALSYAWGSELAPTRIKCNGQDIEITKNLAQALQHLRHESEPTYLWADALCINQQDAEEKGHQVVLMKDIYAYAQEVSVWLGPDEEHHAAELFAKVDEMLILLEGSIKDDFARLDGAQWIKFDIGRPTSPILDKLALLFQREYFTRTWVIQEVGLANRPVACCGKSVINFNKLAVLAMAFLKYFHSLLSSLGYLKEFERAANLYQTYFPQPGSQRLYDIIHRARLNDVTDSRDRIYAFISHPSARENASDFPYTGEGILKVSLTDEDIKLRALSVIVAPTADTWRSAALDYIGNHPPRPPSPDEVMARKFLLDPGQLLKAPRYWPGSSFIKPNYNLSVVDVYLDFARQMIKRFDSLEILSFVQHSTPLAPTGPGFPSWVPRWDSPSDVLVFGGVRCDHFASANKRPIITPSPDIGSLIVRGQFFDRVGLHTIPLTRDDFTDDSKTSPLWSMTKTCQVDTYPVPDYPRIYAPGVVLMQNPDRLEAYRQTWIAGRTMGTGDGPRDYLNPELDFAAHQLDYFKRNDRKEPFTDIPHLMRMATLENEAKGGNGARYAEAAGNASHGRCFFITKAGFFGLGPKIIEPEDAVVILLGADVPFIIREKPKCGDNSAGWTLIGECYVRGLMTGDTIRAWGGPDGDLKDITLC